MGLLGYGYTDEDGRKVSFLEDAFNGGGAGRYGDTFQGSPVSGILNALGVRPMGYAARQERMGDVRPRPRPSSPSLQSSPPAPVMTRRDWAGMPSAPNYPQTYAEGPQTTLEAYLAGTLSRWTPSFTAPYPITVTPLAPGNTRTLDEILGPAYTPRFY